MYHFVLLALTIGAETRVLLDAHNCYPYDGQFADRIDRALATGLPVAIEQDLAWHRESGRSVVSHEKDPKGTEPSMREYFFERVRPLIERELKSGNRKRWPVIVLNLDFKTNEPEHHRAIWKTLGEYEPWLTTAAKNRDKVSKLDVKPILVLTGSQSIQEKIYFDELPERAKLRLFGAADSKPGEAAPAATNYRRWWNNPWAVVERGGQKEAGDWTDADRERLKTLVDHAHKRGLWIRFYTLNGHDPAEGAQRGWFNGYNFGSLDAAQKRWQACMDAGVDFIATDQYEEFAAFRSSRPRR